VALHRPRTLSAVSRSDAPRSAEATQIREALQELLQSEGWKVFLLHVAREYQGAGYHARMGTALKNADNLEARVVHQTALELARVCQWPEDHVRALSGVVE
jgi:hypothetical protein